MFKEVRVMQQQILDILMSMQKDLSEVKGDVTNVKKDLGVLQNDVTNVKKDLIGLKGNVMNLQKNLKEVQTDIHEVKTTVDRIELAQTEDVIGILKVNKKKTDFEVEYLNNRLTEMDKRIYVLEKK
jgi:chromosome segregation ATPase